MSIRDRIKELRRVRAGDLVPSPDNWRTHPQSQQDALRGVLSEVGYADALLARELPDGSLGLLDGHCRRDLDPEQVVPVLVLDLDEAEGRKLMLTLDPLAAMAGANAEALDALLREVDTGDAAVRAMLDDMAAKAELDSTEALSESDMREDNPKLKAFIEARELSRAIGQDVNEVNFWVCLVFGSWDQKQEFLKQISDVPTLWGMYVDGETLATAISKPVTPAGKPFVSRVNKKLAEMALGNNPSEAVSGGLQLQPLSS